MTPAVADLPNQIPSAPFAPAIQEPEHGRVAQLAERAPEKREVTGSMPVPTTRNSQLKKGGNPRRMSMVGRACPNAGPATCARR